MTREQLEARIREQFDAWNRHDVQAIGAVYREDAVAVGNAGQEMRGREAVVGWAQMWLTAFPDLHFDIVRIIVDGDEVAAEWRAQATHRGELMGIPPTGRTTTGVGSTWMTVDADGAIVSSRAYFDSLAILRDLGAMPEPEVAATS